METLKTILFLITFYCTIVVSVTQTKLFQIMLADWVSAFKLKHNWLTTIISLLMWLYQIWFWFGYFGIKIGNYILIPPKVGGIYL